MVFVSQVDVHKAGTHGFASFGINWMPILGIWQELCQSNAGTMD
jgi:hypothetical protein